MGGMPTRNLVGIDAGQVPAASIPAGTLAAGGCTCPRCASTIPAPSATAHAAVHAPYVWRIFAGWPGPLRRQLISRHLSRIWSGPESGGCARACRNVGLTG
jgi:hypothetical protein